MNQKHKSYSHPSDIHNVSLTFRRKHSFSCPTPSFSLLSLFFSHPLHFNKKYKWAPGFHSSLWCRQLAVCSAIVVHRLKYADSKSNDFNISFQFHIQFLMCVCVFLFLFSDQSFCISFFSTNLYLNWSRWYTRHASHRTQNKKSFQINRISHFNCKTAQIANASGSIFKSKLTNLRWLMAEKYELLMANFTQMQMQHWSPYQYVIDRWCLQTPRKNFHIFHLFENSIESPLIFIVRLEMNTFSAANRNSLRSFLFLCQPRFPKIKQNLIELTVHMSDLYHCSLLRNQKLFLQPKKMQKIFSPYF